MVALADKNTRDTIGIDSVERAIVFSALLLRKAYLEENTNILKDAYQIAPQSRIINNILSTNITVIGNIFYDSNSLNSGGNVLENITEKSTNESLYTGKNLRPSENIILPIEDDTLAINNLEKYFY